MADINECKELLQYRATKSGYNGNLSPNDFNRIWNSAERRYFNILYKQYGINQDNLDGLVRFKSDPITIAIDNNGKYNKPNDLIHIDSIRRTVGSKEVEVDKVNDDRLGSHLDSEYDAPTVNYPIYVEYKTYLQFYPKDLANSVLVYLKRPPLSKWAYTLTNGRPVYDSTNSVQPIWNDNDLEEIIYQAGIDLGLNLRDQTVLQVNDVKAKENV